MKFFITEHIPTDKISNSYHEFKMEHIMSLYMGIWWGDVEQTLEDAMTMRKFNIKQLQSKR